MTSYPASATISPGGTTMPIHDWTRVYAGLFHDFHQTWSIYMKDTLNAGMLPNGMAALVERSAGSKEFYSDLANRIVVKHQLGRTIGIIEIVSPGNKDSKRAFQQFLDRRHRGAGGVGAILVPGRPVQIRDQAPPVTDHQGHRQHPARLRHARARFRGGPLPLRRDPAGAVRRRPRRRPGSRARGHRRRGSGRGLTLTSRCER